MKITGKLTGELDIKRFYLEGVHITDTCPNGHECDMDGQYESNPPMNEPFEMAWGCWTCEAEWTTRVVLEVALRVATP